MRVKPIIGVTIYQSRHVLAPSNMRAVKKTIDSFFSFDKMNLLPLRITSC